MKNLDELWGKYRTITGLYTNDELGYITKENFAQAIAEIFSQPLEAEVSLPSIQIDKEALRFEFSDGGENLFWEDLFVGQRTANFQADIMRNLFKAYNEIIARSN